MPSIRRTLLSSALAAGAVFFLLGSSPEAPSARAPERIAPPAAEAAEASAAGSAVEAPDDGAPDAIDAPEAVAEATASSEAPTRAERNRRRLFEINIATLRVGAEEAEEAGDPQRAELMRLRAERLTRRMEREGGERSGS